MMRVKAHRHIPLRSRARLQRIGVQQDPALPSRAQGRFRLQHLLQAARAYSQTERQGRRAAAAAEIQRKRRVQQRLLSQKLEQAGVEMAPPTTPAAFAMMLSDDLAKWARIVRTSGAAVD